MQTRGNFMGDWGWYEMLLKVLTPFHVSVDAQKDYHIKSDSTQAWTPGQSPTRPPSRPRGKRIYA